MKVLLLYLQLQIMLSFVCADYQLEVTVHSFSNPLGVDANGDCCDTIFASSPNCPVNACESEFAFCLDGASPSSYGPTSSFTGDNVTFGASFIEFPDIPNPLIFTGPSWPAGGNQLLVKVEDDDGVISFNDPLDNINVGIRLDPGQSIEQESYSGQFSSMVLSFSLTCTSLFGPNCDDHCPSLSDPANGSVQQSSVIAEGSTATYSCDLGYALIGESTRMCQSGEWSNNEPVCQLGCGPLLNPPNGWVDAPATTMGSMATYSCNANFVLQGNPTRTCLLTGWSANTPSCLRDCGSQALRSPLNGVVEFSVTTEGSTATYSCNPGFGLQGSRTRTCLSSGLWSNTAPSCARDCGGLPEPVNGRVELTSTTEGSVATYSCNQGYALSTTSLSTRTCQPTGTWSGEPATCVEIASSANVGAVAGGVVGGVIVLAIVIGVAVLVIACVLKNYRQPKFNTPQHMNCNPDPKYNFKQTSLTVQEVPTVVTLTSTGTR